MLLPKCSKGSSTPTAALPSLQRNFSNELTNGEGLNPLSEGGDIQAKSSMERELAKLHPIVRALVIVFFIGPCAASLCGMLAASVGMPISMIYAGEPQAIPGELIFGWICAVILGAPLGFVLMLLVVWPIRNEDVTVVLRYLVGGTLLFALPVACIPNGVSVSHWAGIVGFWVGFTRLTIRNFTKEDWRQFVFGKSGYGI